MKLILSRLLLFLAFGTCLFADDLAWGWTWAGVWAGFGTGPYTAIDATLNNKTLVIFCLDYNDEIAPPYNWKANIRPLTATNVTQYAQFGGNYGQGITTTPWAFTGDAGLNGHAVDLSASFDPYTRYQEAAWLFTNILTAQTHNDLNSMIISQVAAWELFVENGAKISDLHGKINATNGTGPSTYTNYLYSNNSYASTPGIQSMTNLLFRDAVNEALNAAQDAVLNQSWYRSAFAPSWDLVTGDPTWTAVFGRPVQEFLSDPPPNPNAPPIPEPGTVILLGTVMTGLIVATRRKLRQSIVKH